MRKHLSVYDVATRYRKAVSTLYLWLGRGWMPAPTRLGGRVFWYEDELDAWEAAGFPRPCDQKQEQDNANVVG